MCHTGNFLYSTEIKSYGVTIRLVAVIMSLTLILNNIFVYNNRIIFIVIVRIKIIKYSYYLK